MRCVIVTGMALHSTSRFSVGPRTLDADIVRQTAATVDPRFLHTPLFENPGLSRALGVTVELKVETLNPIRCFKGRGASVYVADHVRRRPAVPMVAASAGNWGQALALACGVSDVDLTVFSATTANVVKVERMRELGAHVVLVGDDFDAAKDRAREVAAESGAEFAEDGADPIVSAGHGSCAMEITTSLEGRGISADAVLVPLGNGALVNGIGAWLGEVAPSTSTVGVAAAGAPSMHDSFLAGAVVEGGPVETIADGLAVRCPIPAAVADMCEHVDDTVLVSEAHLEDAQELILRHAGLVVEPSGAAGVAALLADADRWSGARVVAVLTGSNVSP